jgi:hypothetical protein
MTLLILLTVFLLLPLPGLIEACIALARSPTLHSDHH